MAALPSLTAWAPPWARIWLRRLALLLNIALVGFVLASAEEEGVGLEVAQTWTAVASFIGQVSLFWQLVKQPQATAEHLSLQCLGIQALCHCTRFLGLSAWTVQELPLVPLLAGLSPMTFALATWHRQRLREELEKAEALGGEAFGAELLRSLQGPRTAALPVTSARLWRFLEFAVLPAAAFLLGLLVQVLLDVQALATGWRPWVAAWHQALEAGALLPQFRVLLELRVVPPDNSDAVAVVPAELAYWLTSLALGHFFACVAAFGDSWRGGGRPALGFACGEAFNAALLGELLLAHLKAKWHGDKRLALPL